MFVSGTTYQLLQLGQALDPGMFIHNVLCTCMLSKSCHLPHTPLRLLLLHYCCCCHAGPSSITVQPPAAQTPPPQPTASGGSKRKLVGT